MSPIVILIIGWLLSILISQPSEKFPQIINFMIKNPYVVIFFIVFWLIFTVIYTELQRRNETLQNDIKIKDEIIKEKVRQLKNSAGIILNKSGDLADFRRLLRFKEVLKGFTENNTIVECVQIYNYSTKRIDNVVNIKVSYDSGFCSDGIDINNLAQCHYDIDYNDYNTLKDIIKIWKKLSSDDHIPFTEKDSLIQILVKGINEIYRKYYNSLQSLNSINDVNSQHFTQYRIMTLLLRLARRETTTMLDKKRLLKNDILEDYLLNGKRTGILNSILLEDIFMFKYTRNSHKKNGRAYISFPLNISMQKYICVFSIQTRELDKSIDLEYEIKSLIKDDIVKRFEKN